VGKILDGQTLVLSEHEKGSVISAMVWGSRYFGVAEERSPLAQKAAENLLFYDFCDYLENNPGLTKPQFDELLDLFYSQVNVENENEDENFSAYPIVRLLLPVKDSRRRLTEVSTFGT
jgi:hypothetical protein